MWQCRIFIYCCFVFGFLDGSSGSGFDFNPHEIIRKSRSVPVSLEIAPKAVSDSLTYILPTSFQDSGAEALLNRANTLAQQANDLLATLKELEDHFSSTDGYELGEVKNMTEEVTNFSVQYTSLVASILQINQTIESNANGLSYVETQLTCMEKSGCHGEPTSPPPPAAFNCTATNQTVSKAGDGGSWSFPDPTTFKCSLTITSKNGLWLNITVTNFKSINKGKLEIVGETSGSVLETIDMDTSMANFPDISDTGVIIKLIDVVSFTLVFSAVDPCNKYDCHFGNCSITPANQPSCACQPCYSGTEDSPCSTYVDPCAGRPNQLCQAVAGGVCIPQTSGDLCNYYCKCPGKPLDCQQQWCDDEPNCESSKKLDSKMFWKRQDTFEDFNPHEFVQQAQADATSLNFTIPDVISERDPYELLEDATELTNIANNLLSELQDYLDLFNNTSSGDQWNDIQQWTTRYNLALNAFGPLHNRTTALQDTYDAFGASLTEFNTQLICLAESNCHSPPVTTTRAPPLVYQCNRTGVGNLSAAGDHGSFKFAYVYNFTGCTFKIKSAHRYGLWINIKVSNFQTYDNSSIKIEDQRGSKNYTVNNNSSYFNLTGDEITIYVKGQLQFTLDYSAIDPCVGVDCANGTCSAGQPNNLPKCLCQSCFTNSGPSGVGPCTVLKPKKCDLIYGSYCTNGGGICKNTLDCDYYCAQCPNVTSTCTTMKYCDPQETDCPEGRSFFSGFLKYLKKFQV